MQEVCKVKEEQQQLQIYNLQLNQPFYLVYQCMQSEYLGASHLYFSGRLGFHGSKLYLI